MFRPTNLFRNQPKNQNEFSWAGDNHEYTSPLPINTLVTFLSMRPIEIIIVYTKSRIA